MRKALTLIATVALVVVASATPAMADITSPAANAIVSGTVTISDNGVGSGGTSYLLGYCEGFTRIEVLSGSTVIASKQQAGVSGALSPTSLVWSTDGRANGTYTLRSTNARGTIGFFRCNTSNTVRTRTVTLQNAGNMGYTGATTGPVGTTVVASATLVNQNGVAPPSGQTVTFSLTGQPTTYTATTNAAGTAAVSIPLVGPPRGATVSASYAGGFITAASASAPFAVTAIPTSTAVTSSQNPSSFGQNVTFTANVSSPQSGAGTPTGSVQFKVDGANLGSPVTLSGGSATSPAAAPAAGTRTITAVYAPTGNYGASTGSLSQVVARAQTATVVEPRPGTVYGEAVSFTANVSVVPPGAGSPTGTVTFQQNGEPVGAPVPLVGGVATSAPIATLGANPSAYAITALYSGDDSFGPSSGSSGHLVGKASTTTAVVSASSPAVSGQTSAFTASVSPVSPGAGVPTGAIQFFIGLDPMGGPVALDGGQATSPDLVELEPGTYEVTAGYLGDGNFVASSATFEHVVTQAATATSLTSSANPSVFGQPVVFTAGVSTVSPGAGTPAGTVTFSVDGVDHVVDLDGGGMASYTTADLAVGTYEVTATYNGSVRSLGSSDNVTQVVNRAATSTALSSSVTPSVSGQEVTFTADVTVDAPGAGSPGGSVAFYDGATLLGSVPVTSGSGSAQATFATAGLTVGSHAITAEYSGDAAFEGSDATVTQGVNQASSQTVVVSNGAVVQGQPSTFTATVTYVAPGAGTPTGTVQFKLNGTNQGPPVAVEPDGSAVSPPIPGLSPGSYTVTGVYSGDGNLLGSSGFAGQEVTTAGTETTLVSSANPAAYGAPVTLTATVSVPAPGMGAPTGTVTFYDGQILIGSAVLEAGDSGQQASITVADLTVGAHPIRAEYLGSFGFDASSAELAQVVSTDPTTTVVTSSTNPSVFDAPVTLTATVTPAVANGNPATGTMTFLDGATVLATVPVTASPAGATATTTVPAFAVGSHPITATYSGDAQYGGSTSMALTQVVTKRATTLTATKDTSSSITATLSTSLGPLAGKTVVVTTGTTTICTGTTDGAGKITCNAGGHVFPILLQGYVVSFAGDGSYLPASVSGN